MCEGMKEQAQGRWALPGFYKGLDREDSRLEGRPDSATAPSCCHHLRAATGHTARNGCHLTLMERDSPTRKCVGFVPFPELADC